ncbi:protein of unknown function [Methylocella tundrae]|uniref:Uncharacterized protein n=1 Tax=Methylocella tundrae TaxID=227605 RepID=A0A4U8YXG4_METTU|nr:protein of unknown function [Methylocella tundrae]
MRRIIYRLYTKLYHVSLSSHKSTLSFEQYSLRCLASRRPRRESQGKTEAILHPNNRLILASPWADLFLTSTHSYAGRREAGPASLRAGLEPRG